jgi:myo-inositol-1(or 4)-monophosphatase
VASEDPLPDLGPIALTAALAGAAAIRSVVDTGPLGTQFKSGGHDMVTAADKASEQAVIDVLRAARPADSILGEEGGVHEGSSGVRWLVDPLDGTANFVYGRVDHAVSVGAETSGKPFVGAIIRPADGQWIMAGSNGVTSGREPRAAHGRTDSPAPGVRQCRLDEALVAFGLPYSLPARRKALTIIAALVPQLRGVRVIGSAASDLAAVALGQCDAFVGFGLAEWDTAAGHAIVIAAGGVVRETDQQRSERALIAGSSAVVDGLVALMNDP